MYKRITEPWIGKDYQTGINDCQVLAIGESHYCKNVDQFTPKITQEIIRDLYDPNSEFEYYKNTYSKFVNAIAGEKQNFYGKEIWWNKLAFYNYIQTPMSGPRKSPKKAEYQQSEEAFWEILEKIRPTHLIVWGYRLYNNLPQKGCGLSSIIMSDGSEIEQWQYNLKDRTPIKVLRMKHPSSSYSTSYWHEAITKFLLQ